MDNMIYLDNAATVYPKPKEIIDFMFRVYSESGVNPGRSGYDICLEAEAVVMDTRKSLNRFFNGTDPDRLVFTYNASDSLNIVINGILSDGDHVITSNLEHNSVIRPINHLRAKGLVDVDYIPFDESGYIDPDDIKRKIRKNTKLVIINHGSNVIGTVQPVGAIGKLCRECSVTFAIDAAQTAGIVPINMQEMNIDIVAFTGHKSLLGPTGIGGICIRDDVEITQTRFGGTGVRSAYPFHLPEYPWRLEVGTLNILGIAGLNAGLRYIERKGIENILREELELLDLLTQGLAEINNVKLYGTKSLNDRVPVLSFNIGGFEASDVGMILDGDHNIAVRTGLHCAPKVHEQLGTAPTGTARFGIGPMNTKKDIQIALEAVEEIAMVRATR